ncbi:MAG: DUF447 family protein [Methylobacillus sp.]|nr:DUF447 family protein [Methylobacillus sp.]
MIHETVITTLNPDSTAHIAPFGVRERDGHIIVAPFRPSASLDNMLRARCAVINFTDDVRIFAGALTGRCDWPVFPATRITGHVLAAALAHCELELIAIRDDDTRPELTFRVAHEVTHRPFRGFNRAQAAVLEAAVLVSRLHMLPPEKIAAETEYLKIAVEKTAGEREWQAWTWLMERIENHNAELRGDNLA